VSAVYNESPFPEFASVNVKYPVVAELLSVVVLTVVAGFDVGVIVTLFVPSVTDT